MTTRSRPHHAWRSCQRRGPDKAGMMVGEFDLALAQFGGALAEEVEADADEILLRGGGGADPAMGCLNVRAG